MLCIFSLVFSALTCTYINDKLLMQQEKKAKEITYNSAKTEKEFNKKGTIALLLVCFALALFSCHFHLTAELETPRLTQV